MQVAVPYNELAAAAARYSASPPYARGRMDLKASFCEARSSVLRAPSSQIGWDDDAVDALGVNGSGSVGIIAPLLMVQTVAA
jgi:hypothetical protein